MPIKREDGLQIGDIIRHAREAAGMNRAELGRKIGVSRQTVGDWEKNETAPSRANAPDVARALKIPLSSISGDPVHANVAFIEKTTLQSRHVPLIDFADAGKGAAVADPYPAGHGYDYVETTFRVSEETFALEVRGESMEPDYKAGDIIIIDPQVEPLPDDDVVAELLPDGGEEGSGEVTFKRYKPRHSDVGSATDLVPVNPDFETVTINRRNPGRIIGVVVEHRIPRRR